MSDLLQGRASVMLGPDAGSLTDYSCAFRAFVINERRNTVVKAPTPSSPAFEEKAGAKQATVTAVFLSAYVTTSGLWAELLAALDTDTGELYFEWKAANTAVGASNPKRTGFIVVTDLDTGAAGYAPRLQSKTFPARSISAPIVA